MAFGRRFCDGEGTFQYANTFPIFLEPLWVPTPGPFGAMGMIHHLMGTHGYVKQVLLGPKSYR
jgi:hypothetical protein